MSCIARSADEDAWIAELFAEMDANSAPDKSTSDDPPEVYEPEDGDEIVTSLEDDVSCNTDLEDGDGHDLLVEDATGVS